MSEEEKEKRKIAWQDFKQALFNALKIEEMVEWLANKLDKAKENK